MRIFIALLDGVGVGELPDAELYGDAGSHTLRNTAQAVGGLHLPNLEKLGLGCIDYIPGVTKVPHPQAFYGKMRERSAGKDTLTGHWEIAGIILDKPFPVYPRGFPPQVVRRIEEVIGKPILGNKPASGTAIIEELGAEHLRTGYPIVYTSADSVLQIAAHEEVIPPPQLYEICRKVREVMTGEHAVARVIARPFVGSPGNFVRTPRRKDFSLPPPSPTVLEVLIASGREVIGVGKIGEIFAFRGISDSIKTADNADTFRVFSELQKSGRGDLVWANFNDFDTLYGHRNNPHGFAMALQSWDATLADFLASLKEDELLIITSDHGCDPTTPSTDHSREYALLLVYLPARRRGLSLGIRDTFCDVAHSIAELLGVEWHGPGTSFASKVLS